MLDHFSLQAVVFLSVMMLSLFFKEKVRKEVLIMPKYTVKITPGKRAEVCTCKIDQQRYTVKASSKDEAMTLAGNRWYDAECPDKPPEDCPHSREDIISECSYIVQEV
ncbi:MAG: hypothetical protein D3909_18060 [Candidatus Electrothrix sp. ATG1]|nr:hypothetical protein [Candidatus Electrothrix sp. ATG1]